MSVNASFGDRPHPMSPMPATGLAQELIASGTTLSQDFGDAVSTIVSVVQARAVTLWLSHDAHASESGGYVVVLPMISAANTAPAIGADSWYSPGLADATASEADIAAGVTLISGADYTKGPEWRSIEVGPLLITTQAHGNSEKSRLRLPRLDVADARWLYVACIQQGDTTNFGTVGVNWSVAL